MKSEFTAFCAGAALITLASCSVPAGWSVDGVIDNAPEGITMALENYNNGIWLLVDSLRTRSNGAFGYEAESPAHYPELMRLTLPGHGSIYFPVDSTENILIESSMDDFGSANISGSQAAAGFAAVDSIISAHGNTISTDLQHDIARIITSDTTGIVAYYAVSKSIGSSRIFNPAESFGNRIYGAAAQVYAQHHPSDPRGAALRQAYFNGRIALGRFTPADSTTVVEVPETGLIEIERYDYAGNRHSLVELAGQGKVVLLSFTAYDIPQSPEYNALLNSVYNRFHNAGLEIYQIAFDSSEPEWKAAAANLPWITVWNSPTDGNAALLSYNVGVLPLTYIIDRNGDIGARITDPGQIEDTVSRYFR